MAQQCYECGRQSPLNQPLAHFHGCEYYRPDELKQRLIERIGVEATEEFYRTSNTDVRPHTHLIG